MANHRLPEVNGDDGAWGTILNDFLTNEHYNNDNAGAGSADSGGHQHITLRAGSTAGGTAPITLIAGPLMSTAETGAIEFNNSDNNLYFTSTGTTREMIATSDLSGNLPANNLIEAYSMITTAATTTTLTITSKFQQYFTGSTTQTVVMPVVSTLTIGQQWQINNSSTGVDAAGAITIQSSGLNTILVLPAGSYATLTCISNSGTGVGSWAYNQNTSHITVSKTQPTSAVIGDLWIDMN